MYVGGHLAPRAPVPDAFHRAASRGVFLTLLVERPADRPGYDGPATPLPDVAARRLAWPRERHLKRASLHAKVIVIDRATALVSSANLTGAAMDRNLERGVLLRGDGQPASLRRLYGDR
jgi:cardiolipin synthase A/B